LLGKVLHCPGVIILHLLWLSTDILLTALVSHLLGGAILVLRRVAVVPGLVVQRREVQHLWELGPVVAEIQQILFGP